MLRVVKGVFLVTGLLLGGVSPALAQPDSTFSNAVTTLFDHFVTESRAALIECPAELVEAYRDQWRLCGFVEDDPDRHPNFVKLKVEYAILLDNDRFEEPPPYDYWLDRGGYETRILQFTRTGDYLLLGIYDGIAGNALGAIIAFVWEE